MCRPVNQRAMNSTPAVTTCTYGGGCCGGGAASSRGGGRLGFKGILDVFVIGTGRSRGCSGTLAFFGAGVRGTGGTATSRGSVAAAEAEEEEVIACAK